MNLAMNNAQCFSLALMFILVAHLTVAGQTKETKLLSLSFEQASLTEIIERLSTACDCPIFQAPTEIEFKSYTGTFERQSVEHVLMKILDETPLSILSYDDQVIVVGERSKIEENVSSQYFQALEESLSNLEAERDQTVVIGRIADLSQSGRTTVRGKVIDGESGEPIIGATIQLNATGVGTATDELGQYELDIKPGSYQMAIHYIGYRSREMPIKLVSSGNLDIALVRGGILLDEIVVEAQARDENVQSTQSGVTRLVLKEIKTLPSFLGEVDIIKSLLLQPGVSSIGEGSSGFNIRGGNVDQNLILMDEAILMNSSHALGFFSAFNPDIVSDAVLYKANIPAKYGGRLASALNINVKDGDFEKTNIKGGLGLVSSRMTISAPINKDKTSFLISGRSTYSNWLLKAIKLSEVKSSSVSFFDANFRLTHRINERNFISLTAYRSKDDFIYNNQFGFDYQTTIGQLTYQSLVSKNLFSTLSVVFNDYQSNQEELRPNLAARLGTATKYWKIKENLNLSINGLSLDGGISMIRYDLSPGNLDPQGDQSVIASKSMEDERGVELAPYLTASYDVSPRLALTTGLRYTAFRYLGPRTMYVYEDPSKPREEEILDRIPFTRNPIFSDGRLEPRLSSRYKISAESSIKFGYSRTSQFINQISNNETPTPTSIWQLSNQYIPPQLSHNLSLGYFRNFKQNNWITSFELFYRDIDQLFDYKDFADLITNSHLETELRSGIGRSQGLEVSIKKQVGVIHGWLSYTHLKSERKVETINDGEWYPSVFDKPHEVSLVTNIQINKRSIISINFNYASGRPITIPVDRHVLGDRLILLNYSLRNGFRIPDYHRLDIAYTLGQGIRKSHKFKTSWTFSVYNLYGRRNAFAIFLDQQIIGDPKIKRLSVLGSAFPSLTFNFELL